MTRKKSASPLVLMAAAAALVFGTAAQAQEDYGAYPAPYADPSPGYYPGDEGYDSYRSPYSFEDLTIIAPRSRVVGRSSTTGAPIEQVSISRVVSARDLDLRSPWGVDALYARIDQAARDACREMDNLYPISVGGDPPCVRTAARRAYAQADYIVSAAGNR
jgi:UrcA family protein